MCGAVANITFSVGEALNPGVKIDRPMELDIDSAHAHPLSRNAREVGLARSPNPAAAIEQVIPHIKLGDPVGIHGADKVASRHQFPIWTGQGVGILNDELIGPDAIVGGNVKVGQPAWAVRGIGNPANETGQPVGRMGRAADSPLFLGPAQGVHAQCGPVMLGFPTRIDLLLEPQ